MVSVLASSTLDSGFETVSGQTNDYIKLILTVTLPSMQHQTERVHVEQHCLPGDCSMSKHYKNPTKCVSLV